MGYPTKFMGYDFAAPDDTDTVVGALLKARKNDMLTVMTQMYAGVDQDLWFPGPRTHLGDWVINFRYGREGFDHTYENADPAKEWDTVEAYNGAVRFAWNFTWKEVTSSVPITVSPLIDATYWYFDAGIIGEYEYLGKLSYIWPSGQDDVELESITWDSTASDPNLIPGEDE